MLVFGRVYHCLTVSRYRTVNLIFSTELSTATTAIGRRLPLFSPTYPDNFQSKGRDHGNPMEWAGFF